MRAKMKRFATLLALLLAASASRLHAGPDEDFIALYHQLQEADHALNNGNTAAARTRYVNVQAGLKRLQEQHPGWSPKVIEFRLQYVNEKLATLGPVPGAPTTKPAAPAAPANPLDELRRQVAELQQERSVLQNKLQEALSAQPAAIDPRELQKAETRIAALEKERDLLKVAVEQAQAQAAKAADQSEAQKEIAALKAQLAASAAPNVAVEREAAAAKEAARTNMMAMASLQAQLAAAREELKTARAAAPAPTAKGSDSSASHELAVLRARMAVLEANKVPYTPEELALFQKPSPAAQAVAAAAPTPRTSPGTTPAPAARRTQRELPPGADIKLAQARTAVRDRKFADAERLLDEVLKMDDRNVFVLGMLAAVQLEQGRLKDSEATLERVRAIDPDDPGMLTNLGALRFRQGNFDEALTLLSRAAEIDPKNPETQNFLGATLAEKGQRVAAETALRRAVQMSPGYAPAHFNLAVTYANQEPPFTELARYHYQRALAAGSPANPKLEEKINASAKK